MENNNHKPGNHIKWDGETILSRGLLAYCRFPNYPFKIRIGKFLANIFFRNGVPVRNISGARMLIDMNDFIGHSIAYSGSYEPLSLNLAMELLKDGGNFLDIGCNVGLYTITLGALDSVKCISIDASPKALVAFDANLELNKNIDVITVQALLGESNDISEIELPVSENLGTMRVTENSDKRKRLLSLVTTLDEVLKKLGQSPIKLMKIDVEGSELNIFKGLNWEGDFAPENIIMEYNKSVSSNLKETFSYLQSRGYNARAVTGDEFNPDYNIPEENCWFYR